MASDRAILLISVTILSHLQGSVGETIVITYPYLPCSWVEGLMTNLANDGHYRVEEDWEEVFHFELNRVVKSLQHINCRPFHKLGEREAHRLHARLVL